MTKRDFYWPYLDLLRCLAILLVLVVHYFEILKLKMFGLQIGIYVVDLFFTISGFLITYILLDQKKRNISISKVIKGFYIKRTLRLFPLYYALLILTYILELIWQLDFNFTDHALWYIFYSSNFLYTFFNEHSRGFLDPTWSLAVEEQFYLIWPIILIFLKSKRNILWTIIVMICSSFVAIVYFESIHFTGRYRFLTICNFHTLGAGALLAYFKFYYEEKIRDIFYGKIALITFLSLIAFVTSYRLAASMSSNLLLIILREITLIFLTFFSVLLSTWNFKNNKFVTKYLINPLTLYIGKISYGIYLLHYPVSKILDICLANLSNSFYELEIYSPQIRLLLYVSLTFGIAHFSWKYFEKFFLQFKANFNY